MVTVMHTEMPLEYHLVICEINKIESEENTVANLKSNEFIPSK